MQTDERIGQAGPRKENRGRDPERSKRMLIQSTLDSLAEDGLSDTTVSNIVARAGLSRGLIHLHFGGKDKLIAAAAEVFAERYYDAMERRLDGRYDDPAAVILTVVRADLSEEILNEYSVAVWHSLRGAARQSPDIARFSDTRDRRLRRMVYEAFLALHGTGSGDDAHGFVNDATLGTLALLEGMWTDFMVHPKSFNRDSAFRIVTRFLAALFPDRL